MQYGSILLTGPSAPHPVLLDPVGTGLAAKAVVREEEQMSTVPGIPQAEFDTRLRRLQSRMSESDLDVLVVHSDEAEFANVRYLSNFWPIWENAGVIRSLDAASGPCGIAGEFGQREDHNAANVRGLSRSSTGRQQPPSSGGIGRAAPSPQPQC